MQKPTPRESKPSPTSTAVGMMAPGPLAGLTLRAHKRDVASVPVDTVGQIHRAIMSESWPIFITGPVGVGKTCAALCLADSWSLPPVFYSTVADAQRAVFENPKAFWDRWVGLASRGLQGAGLAILDELGMRGKVSDARYDLVHRLIDSRHGMPLVAISNLSLSELAEVYDDRIASRLAAGVVIMMTGQDRRIR